MRNSLTIARRELATYFNTPIAYIIIVVFLAVSSFLFFTELFIAGQADLRPFFGLAPLLFCFFCPLMTMRLLAEEKKNGTLELLLSFPVTDWQVVVGKFLAALGLGTVMILLTTPFAFYVGAYGPLDKGPVIGGYLGLLLMMAGYLAIGLMASVWTKEQIVAAIIAFIICFTLFLSGKLLQVVPPSIARALQQISTDHHFQNIARGVVDTRDLFYYLTLIGVPLVIAQASLESRKWR